MYKLPSKKDILKIYSYDPITGVFTRIKKYGALDIGHTVKPCSRGYIRLSINGHRYSAHRLAWTLINGDPIGMDIDHINHDRSDNRINNLRLVNKTLNGQNKSIGTNNTTGFVGVCWMKGKKSFRASIKVDGKLIYLGQSKSIIDAVIRRIKANIKYGFHKNHGVL